MNARPFRVGAAALLATAAAAAASAMPNLARKYDYGCNQCHTVIPQLNEFGFQFRKAGFRPPEEIGKDTTKTTIADVFAARIQARYDYRRHDDAGDVTDSHQLTLHEVTLYPLSASFGKHYGSLVELSIAGEDFVEIENAYFRVAFGSKDSWFSGRVGIYHPFEGYGASDRPLSIDRPLFQTTAANHNQSTFFTPWGFDEAGLELAYVFKRTSLSATLFNGIFVADDEGAFKAFPAAGGELVKSNGFKKTNAKDVQILLNQILKDDASGISGYFYYGSADQPIPGTAADEFDPLTSWGNTYYRAAVYGSYSLVPKRFWLQGGYQVGRDHVYDLLTTSTGGTFDSEGFFGEAYVRAAKHVTLGGRYEEFDPSSDKASNKLKAYTAYANMPANDGLQLIAQYRHLERERLDEVSLKDDNLQLRLIWIW